MTWLMIKDLMIIGGSVCCLTLGSEFLYRRGWSTFITRKIVHLGSGVIFALSPWFTDQLTVIAAGILLTFSLFVTTKMLKILPSSGQIDRFNFGPELFFLSVVLSAWWFWPVNVVIFQATTLVLGFSDALACLVGSSFGRHRYYLTGSKTLEGSLAFFFSSGLILIGLLSGTWLPGQAIGWGLCLAAVFTLTEALFSRGWDNLFIVLITGVSLTLLL